MYQIKVVFILVIFSNLACNSKSVVLPCFDISVQENIINELLDSWHKAAADADLNKYFNKMSEDAIYLGTDISERWTKNEFYSFCKPYFDKGKAWEFIPSNRTVYFSENYKTAWFEETLDTWMGECRGSGILVLKNNQWKIIHYNLAVAVSNEIIKDYIKLLDE